MLDALPPPGAFAPAHGEAPPSAMPDMDGLLREFAAHNPNLAWLAQMIGAQRQLTAHNGVGVAEPELPLQQPEHEALSHELAQAQERGERLQRLARRLAHDLEAAESQLADLAAAFGACGLCWGQDPRCRSCRGRGKPGRFAPDPELRLRLFAEAYTVGPPDTSVASRSSTPPDPTERR